MVRLDLKTHKSHSSISQQMATIMSDQHQVALKRQEQNQRKLEEAMTRQEPLKQRDEQLRVLEEWLNKQLESPQKR